MCMFMLSWHTNLANPLIHNGLCPKANIGLVQPTINRFLLLASARTMCITGFYGLREVDHNKKQKSSRVKHRLIVLTVYIDPSRLLSAQTLDYHTQQSVTFISFLFGQTKGHKLCLKTENLKLIFHARLRWTNGISSSWSSPFILTRKCSEERYLLFNVRQRWWWCENVHSQWKCLHSNGSFEAD